MPALPDLVENLPAIEQAAEILFTAFQGGGKLLVCGNGGSAADSERIVGELMKGFNLKRPLPPEIRARLQAAYPEAGAYLADHLQGALPAISLVSQTSLITALINDISGSLISQQVYGYGRPGDVLLGMSCCWQCRRCAAGLPRGTRVGDKNRGANRAPRRRHAATV